jgi:hypothetical protein
MALKVVSKPKVFAIASLWMTLPTFAELADIWDRNCLIVWTDCRGNPAFPEIFAKLVVYPGFAG